MIPCRLHLKGFMCYREETEICFTGSSIWALSGANGAGKSTIFDAMLFALYGEHRMGSQKVWELVHRQTEEFMVVFDFAIGENEYRVKRTYSKAKKKGTMLALYLSGPDMPVPGRTGSQTISGTETKDGFDSWILRTVGLNADTFRVAVLLMQGQSDVLLKLGGAEKHEVLTQIIDLSQYEALCKLAGSKQKEQEGVAKSCVVQLSNLEKIDDAHVLEVENKLTEANSGKEAAKARQLHLAELKEQAKQWQKLQENERQFTDGLVQCRVLLDSSEQIQQGAIRLETLQTVISPLAQIYGRQVTCAIFEAQIRQGSEKVRMLGDSLTEQSDKLRATQQHLGELRAKHVEADREQKELQSHLLELQRDCDAIARLRGLQQKYEDINRQISAYAPDLEQQQGNLKAKLEELERIEAAQPHLKNFAQARDLWKKATGDFAEAQQDLSDQEKRLVEIETQKNLLSGQVQSLSEQLSSLQGEVLRKETLLKMSQNQLERFQLVDGQPTCSYCGLPLTSKHLDDERQRIEGELCEARHVYQEAQAQFTAMAQEKRNLEQELGQLSLQEKNQQQSIKKAERQCNTARSNQNNARIQASIVLRMLTPDYIALIQGSANVPIDLDICLHAVYPTPHDLDRLAEQLQNKSSLKELLQTVTQDVEQLNKLKHDRDYIYGEIHPLEQIYSPERSADLLGEQEQALQRNKELLDCLDRLNAEITQQEEQLGRLGNENQQAEREKGKLERAIAIAGTQLENAQRDIEHALATLPVEWQAQIEFLSEALLEGWKQEIKALTGAAERLQDLRDAEKNFTRYQKELQNLKTEKDLIPEEARQEPSLLEKESKQTSLSYQTFEEQEQSLWAERLRLKNIQDRREELERERVGAARLASSYKDLANLLGRDRLQRYLLQKAEMGIVYHTNDILDHISGGTLRLELQSSTDRKTEALDMVAYNTAISARQPQPIRLLSGSQQFRVSVSLALGIGKYAGNENHRVESVIIDEGFGSLDESGRREMIQAIKELGDGGVLKCIIVVSHQREFFDEFPNRYQVELVDGSTHISLA